MDHKMPVFASEFLARRKKLFYYYSTDLLPQFRTRLKVGAWYSNMKKEGPCQSSMGSCTGSLETFG
jgi:hypothetical protein